jgi:membrane protease YdiL (CAAX protease family)
MEPASRTPWNPDPHWANPFIASLAILSALLVLLHFGSTATHKPAPAHRAGVEARLRDLAVGLTQATGVKPPGGSAFRQLPEEPWDRALEAVDLAELGQLDPARVRVEPGPPGPTGQAFRAAWTWAYLGEGREPDLADRERVRLALGNGYGALRLEARLAERAHRPPEAWARAAQDVVWRRGLVLAGVGLTVLFGALGGLAFGIYLLCSRPRADAPPPPTLGMSGHALLLALLGWFLTLQTSGLVVGSLVRVFRPLEAFVLPLQYALHAFVGIRLLAFAEGLDARALFRRLTPGRTRPALTWGLGFYVLALAAVLLTALALAPVIPRDAAPQRELRELMAAITGWLPLTLVFLTLAVAAPIFEELLFRGALLSWLRTRFGTRFRPGTAMALAVLVSGVAFAAIHLQPWGLPVLAVLGAVLGAAFARTRNLWSAILVHGLWNGGTFALMRFLG